ncbi:hypothetical protein A2U01_0029222, partial [Trifolium medium]|nr:hypothetical protein [Trifolium medium]
MAAPMDSSMAKRVVQETNNNHTSASSSTIEGVVHRPTKVPKLSIPQTNLN